MIGIVSSTERRIEVSVSWPRGLTPKQKRKINEDLRSLGQPDVEVGFEEYLATNEFIAADYSGSAGAIAGTLSALSIVVGIWFVGSIPTGFKFYIAAFAVAIAGVSFLAMYKNSAHDAPRRAVQAIIQERLSKTDQGSAVRSGVGQTSTVAVGGAAVVAAAVTYFVLAARRLR